MDEEEIIVVFNGKQIAVPVIVAAHFDVKDNEEVSLDKYINMVEYAIHLWLALTEQQFMVSRGESKVH